MRKLRGTRGRYTAAERDAALALAEQLGSVAGAARRLGLPMHTLYGWRTRSAPGAPVLERVQVQMLPGVDADGTVTVLGPAGLRLEDMSLEQVAALWRLLA